MLLFLITSAQHGILALASFAHVDSANNLLMVCTPITVNNRYLVLSTRIIYNCSEHCRVSLSLGLHYNCHPKSKRIGKKKLLAYSSTGSNTMSKLFHFLDWKYSKVHRVLMFSKILRVHTVMCC